ncbi:MAG TPA: SsrA-binding protein SmpB [Candidatus Bathyarchaeia archaeon]|nr:SsrA-binding protein SmpB [Candidatus Bathyarchaeia archaeon]
MKPIFNRRARFDYQLLEKIEAGIALTGAEVKSVKAGQMSLGESFARISGDEVWLVNAHISPYPFARQEDNQPRRTRKLLLHKSQILGLKQKMKQRQLTLVPVSCYTKNNKIKVKIALARGKKKYQKKEAKKRKDLEREVEKELRGKI